MSYRLIMSDGSTMDVSDERGQKLKELKLTERATQTVEVNDAVFELGRIKVIKHVYEPTSDKTKQADPNRCKGHYSIQIEISKLIKQKYGKDFAKPLADKNGRERLRVWLHEKYPERKWCDSKVGECACYDVPTVDKTDPLYEWRTLFGDGLKPYELES